MSERTKIIAQSNNQHYPNLWRIWDNGDVEYKYSDSWSLRNHGENFSLWKENIRKLIPGKTYRFMNWYSYSSFEESFTEAVLNSDYCVILDVYGFDPVKCTECNSENIKHSRCLDCGEWLDD